MCLVNNSSIRVGDTSINRAFTTLFRHKCNVYTTSEQGHIIPVSIALYNNIIINYVIQILKGLRTVDCVGINRNLFAQKWNHFSHQQSYTLTYTQYLHIYMFICTSLSGMWEVQ